MEKRMKKLFLILCIGLIAGNVEAQQNAERYDLLSAGKYQVARLKMPQVREFLLSNLVYPKQKKQVNILAYINIPFRNVVTNDPNYLKQNPGYQAAIKELSGYISQGFSDWRQAANAHLPKAYQLPPLQFAVTDGYKVDLARQPRTKNSVVTVVLDARSGKVGLTGSSRARGIAQFTRDGNGLGLIQFLLEQEWMDWLNGQNQPEREAALAAEYKKAAAAVLAGDYYDAATNGKGYNWDKNLSPQAQEYIRTFSQSAAKTWHQQGPWAIYNQYIFTHEIGHLFGLVHIEEPQSIMAPVVNGENVVSRPSDQDGLRLATLVCWYHNQRAKREVCLPVSAAKDASEVKSALKAAFAAPGESAPRL